MPVIRDNPQWAILEFLYGFGSHEYEPCALNMRSERNVLSAKEGSKTYHVNQVYDQFLANNNKKILADTLDCQRKMKHVNKGVVNQYQLVFIFISVVTETPKQTWVNRFQHVGLDSINQPTWNEWVNGIKPFLQGGASFKTEEDIYINGKYDMLPE